jgi:hypothetical protein
MKEHYKRLGEVGSVIPYGELALIGGRERERENARLLREYDGEAFSADLEGGLLWLW